MEQNVIVVKEIRNLIDELKTENGIIDEVVRDGVFNILQNLPDCTLVYYPIESEAVEEGCDGCHVVRTIKGHKEQLVFINTANTRERQAFSVAHELGHIWNVDGRLRERIPDEKFETEDIIDRFAAELLMPEKLFKELAQKKLDEFLDENHRLKMSDMIKVVAFLMDYFFTPYKATVLRLKEVQLISGKGVTLLLNYKDSKYVSDIIVENQYVRLGIRTNQKSVANLQENLALIEERRLFTDNKINAIRKKFNIEPLQSRENVESLIEIKNY
jgi:hypothetical protein